jgi:hypothetical protein
MISFTQYLRPYGRKRFVYIERPKEIEALAWRFIAAGGSYECEELRTGQVSLTAVHEDQDIAIQVCPNGPMVPEKVDELVRQSVQHVSNQG